MHDLPVPNDTHVRQFQDFYHRKFGIEQEYEEAHKTLTALMQFVYLRDLYLSKLKPEDRSVQHAASFKKGGSSIPVS